MRYFKSLLRPVIALLLLLLISTELVISVFSDDEHVIEFLHDAESADENDENASAELSSENSEKFFQFQEWSFEFCNPRVKSAGRYSLSLLPEPFYAMLSRPPRHLS